MRYNKLEKILCRGSRRVSSVLRVMVLSSIRNYSKYHRVLSRAEWDGLMLAKILLGLLIKLLPDSWPILIAVVETQRQWSDKAIARTTPLLMGLFSFATLVAFKMHQTKALVSMEMASWYDKKGELTFSDILAIVRRSIWSNKYFSKSENQPDLDKCSEETINTLIYQLSFAA